MSEIFRLYGTLEPPLNSEHFRMGQLSFTLEEGALRHIKVGDIEIIRRTVSYTHLTLPTNREV